MLWDRTIIAYRIPFSIEERSDLCFHFEEKGATGIGHVAYKGAMIPRIIANWEDTSENIIMILDPRDWYAAPLDTVRMNSMPRLWMMTQYLQARDHQPSQSN